MLRVTIELVPHGVEEQRETIAQAEIVNLGTGTGKYGNYLAKFYYGLGEREHPWKVSYVTHFDRRDLTAWDLLQAALNAHDVMDLPSATII